MSENDIVKRAREGLCEPNVVCPDCDMLREACDEIEMLRAAVGAAGAENERLRAALRDLIDAIDCSPSRLPPAAGPQEIEAQYRAMVYRVSGHHVEKAREALGDE